MKTKGIRILDHKNNLVCVELPDILKEIPNGNLLHWSILYIDAEGNLGEGISLPAFQQQIRQSKNGIFIQWEALNLLSKKFYQIKDLILIGCENENLLRRYKEDQEMYETCDIVIVMFDSSFWEVFSKDEEFINRLTVKFKDIKFLESDFQKQYKPKWDRN